MTKSTLLPIAGLALLMCLVGLVYLPGLQGGFLFDDYPNLEEMGNYGGIVNWETLKAFVLNGTSGPTGRPVSLLSFLLNDNTWPSHASYFKLTNLLIHMVCGLSLFWATLLLLRFYAVNERKAVWIAMLSAAFWVLHPYFVSTTLYIVQRMAQLTTLFSLLGIIGYLKGRFLLDKRPIVSYVTMTLSIGLGTLLATLSKENGALLPLLLLVIEFCRPASESKPAWQWSLIFLWLPSLTIVAALFYCIDWTNAAWLTRPFNQSERLLSEGRIVWEYLDSLFVPQIEGRGLFQDGYQKSTGWLTPVTTLPSHLGLLAILLGALFTRKRFPLFSVAILFFLAAHLMESTVIGLELYFEHRNYLSALFLFLPLASFLVFLADRIAPVVVIIIACLIIAFLAMLTWQRSSLWGDSQRLELYWAQSSPDSPRAQNTLAAYLINHGKIDDANLVIERAARRLPDSSLLTTRLLLQKVFTSTASHDDFRFAGDRLAMQPFDAQAVKGLRTLNDFVIADKNKKEYLQWMQELLEKAQSNRNYKSVPLFIRIMPYLRAQLYLAQGKADHALAKYLEAMELYRETDASLAMVAEMAVGGHPGEALQLLDRAEAIYQAQPEKTLRRSADVYDSEFHRLRMVLHDSIGRSMTPQKTEDGSEPLAPVGTFKVTQ
ncbi:tetratricopeptide repeat protein [Pseudomonas nitroreducens]|uniref:tetratricopeptide repeat protein n=1 Tax=Pseudomonas nitroreducens TaxID=46680 RepID=UPI002449819D|nr:tetratricopeptide repeat protein [Pseudomonas nitroreducens]MDG9853621.1 tetratricopeptide repeat protein [Pseudomonas nitroreducens]MDH1076028.1 tetratricopeptide repeat protein [Pseudomonas nitroreducens]